jgi:hypothetical protein
MRRVVIVASVLLAVTCVMGVILRLGKSPGDEYGRTERAHIAPEMELPSSGSSPVVERGSLTSPLDVDGATREVVGAESPPEVLDASTPPPQPDVPETDLWALEYEGLSAEELHKRVRALAQETNMAEALAADQRHDAGLYEVVPSGKIGSGDATGGDEVTVYQSDTNNELHRITLPKAEFPELYAKRRKLAWLRRRAAAAEDEAATDG